MEVVSFLEWVEELLGTMFKLLEMIAILVGNERRRRDVRYWLCDDQMRWGGGGKSGCII